ncbi:MAG: hypothetical protein GQ535_09305 [Rhodobacteraceae bacterium]|nr:hypothetical protein [Paracoccaceae bacterium]
MKSVFAGCLLFVSTACSSPSPQYLGVDANEQVISGVRFDVYQLDAKAQAIRLQGRLDGGKASIRLAAIHAIEAATGCSVIRTSVEGDNEVIDALLTCS